MPPPKRARTKLARSVAGEYIADTTRRVHVLTTAVSSAVHAKWRALSEPPHGELQALQQEVDTMLTQDQAQAQHNTPLTSTSKPSRPWLAKRTPTDTGIRFSASPSKPRAARTAAKHHPLYQTPATTRQHATVRRTRLAQSRPALSGGLQALFPTPEHATPRCQPPATSPGAPPPLALERTPMSPTTVPRRSISTFIQQLPPTTVTPPSDGKGRRGRAAGSLAAQLQVRLGTGIVYEYTNNVIGANRA